MKSRIRKHGSIFKQICILTVFLLISVMQIEDVEGIRVGILNESRIFTDNSIKQHLRNKSRQKGIVDLAAAKIDKEENQKAQMIEAINLKAQQNFLKASRQAMLLTQSSNNYEDADQVIKNMRMAPQAIKKVDEDAYNAQIQKIASEQPQYQDEYEGFGSLTEMVKNTEKIAESQAEEVIKKEEIKKVAEEKVKTIRAAKTKMTEALNQSLMQKKQKDQLLSNKSSNSNTPSSLNQSIKQSGQKSHNQVRQLKFQPNQSSQDKSKSSESDKKLSDKESMVAQVIDEVVQNEDPSTAATAPAQPAAEETNKEQADPNEGFISKFTSKFRQKEDKLDEEPSNVQTAEEDTPKPKKGMFARFQEQIHQDEADSEKAKEVVQEYQHAMDLPNKSILDRETERLVQEQDDEYALDADAVPAPE